MAHSFQELETLFRGQNPQAKEFRENIWRYNNALAMTSLGCKVDESLNHGNGPYVFKVHGCLSHLAGSLLPQEGESPVFAQLYIYDPADALDRRMQHEANQGLNRQVMAELQDMLYRSHPGIQLYKQAYEITREMPAHQQCRIALRYDRECDQQDTIIFQLPHLMRLLSFFLAMVTMCRVQEILFSTAVMARDFSASVIFIHFIRLCIMFFFFPLDNLDGPQIFLLPAEKMKMPVMENLMQMHPMGSDPVSHRQNTFAIAFFPRSMNHPISLWQESCYRNGLWTHGPFQNKLDYVGSSRISLHFTQKAGMV